ncbi:zinc ABC transporter substrate-binding protein [Paracoccus zhejiangensis]|uniref:High-affinity zinc uptake system protein ZnuA n=1 Tax=Paracoccus zhejiangensis TaxID=1077935 RepID=A0A2H5F2T8_9RHOB|nr:zinc ABC transporter substrate-binding protein [Paracoccus zhejiangensis]AUH65859.1 zinc ABC transporter substrate-binding protein [Paracoccus zhejiangensis]
MRFLPFASAPLLIALGAASATADAPSVIADIPATGSLVQQVLGDLGEVRVLLPAGGNEHHHQIRPSDAAALQEAGLLVWIGPDLTPWLARSADSLNSGVSLRLLDLPETSLRAFSDEDDHDHAHEDGHDHAHGPTDPHAWLDPQNGKIWLTAIAGALSEADPENATTYTANAEAGVAKIDDAAAAVTAQLAPVAQDRFVAFHDAYGYFTEAFGLAPAIPVALGDASTPSAARLSAIRDTITAEKVTCAFPEAGHDPSLIESLIAGTPIRAGEALDPTGSGQPMGPSLYPAILTGMGETISACLGQPE